MEVDYSLSKDPEQGLFKEQVSQSILIQRLVYNFERGKRHCLGGGGSNTLPPTGASQEGNARDSGCGWDSAAQT